jgi:arginyl-tRNA synthetase
MRDVYEWLGVSFDVWYTESECDKPSAELVRHKLAEGFFAQDQGAVGIDLSPWKLGFAMFLKSDGNGLYITKDLELLRRKFEDPAVTRSVYVVDARQKLHFQQLFKTGELMGYPQATKSVHLSYETVNTEDGTPFSSRALNGLKLMDLKRDMESKVTADYLERYRGQWSDEDIRRTAEIVTIGALKYGMLKVDNNTQINFVRDEWLRLDTSTRAAGASWKSSSAPAKKPPHLDSRPPSRRKRSSSSP